MHMFNACLCCKFQIPASNNVGGVAETQTVLQCYRVNKCMSFKGTQFCNNDVNQNSVYEQGIFHANQITKSLRNQSRTKVGWLVVLDLTAL